MWSGSEAALLKCCFVYDPSLTSPTKLLDIQTKCAGTCGEKTNSGTMYWVKPSRTVPWLTAAKY